MTDVQVNAATPVELSQFAGQNLPYVVDVGNVAVMPWAAGISIAANQLIQPTPTNDTGFVYQAGGAGQTGLNQPAWPMSAGGTVVDGSVTWTAIAPPAVSEDTIQSVSWTQAAPPDGLLTVTPSAPAALTALALIGGGTLGEIYTVNVLVTMKSGAIYRAELIISIR
jgi:hypothetical protein